MCVCVLMEEEREGGKTVCKSKCVCIIKTEKAVEYIVCQSKGACVVGHILRKCVPAGNGVSACVREM